MIRRKGRSRAEYKMENTQSQSVGRFENDEFLGAIDSISQWAIGYMDSLETRDVSPSVSPGDTLSMLPAGPPVQGMRAGQGDSSSGRDGWDSVVDDVRSIVEPGLLHWQSPRFFGYFPCSSSMPGVMGELVTAVLNVNGMLWSTSPSATELEMRMMDWCATMFGLPDVFRFDTPGSVGGGCIQGTASEAVLAALVAARNDRSCAGVIGGP